MCFVNKCTCIVFFSGLTCKWCHVMAVFLCLTYLTWYDNLCGCSVAKSCLTLCDPMDSSMPGFTVHHCLPEFPQTRVHWINDAIQPSHPLSPPSPLTLSVSQHQGLFQWVISLYQVAKVLELHRHHQSLQWIFRVDFLWDRLVWSSCCPRDSQESSPTPQFESINSVAFSLLYGPTLTSIHDYWKNHSFDCTDLWSKSDVFLFKTLSRFDMAILPRSRCLLISWLQSPSAVILEPSEIWHCFPHFLHLYVMKW